MNGYEPVIKVHRYAQEFITLQNSPEDYKTLIKTCDALITDFSSLFTEFQIGFAIDDFFKLKFRHKALVGLTALFVIMLPIMLIFNILGSHSHIAIGVFLCITAILSISSLFYNVKKNHLKTQLKNLVKR